VGLRVILSEIIRLDCLLGDVELINLIKVTPSFRDGDGRGRRDGFPGRQIFLPILGTAGDGKGDGYVNIGKFSNI
jgi:hypothetical protein